MGHTILLSKHGAMSRPQQLGGTSVIVIGSHTTHVLSSGQDPSSMGCWSFAKLLRIDNCKVIIASTYQVCSQEAAIGSNTVNTQQVQIMHWQGHHHPQPQKQMLINLTTQISSWIHTRCKVLLCLDLNEDTNDTNPDKGMGFLLTQPGLSDLHHKCFLQVPTPHTHTHGKLTINACLGTKLFVNALIGVWYFPFGLPAMLTGNHCALSLDFNVDILFGIKLPEPEHHSRCSVYSNDMPMV